jgi:aspartyl/asparaginyl-tRNA synthetase
VRIVRGILLCAVSIAVTAHAVAETGLGADDVTVRGCIERDAAASVVIYKLVAPDVSGTKIYRLTAPKDVDVAAHVGHTVDVTGTINPPPNGARQQPELVVKKLTVVSETCAATLRRTPRPRAR